MKSSARIAMSLPVPLRVAILETPAGFELNSAQVAGRDGNDGCLAASICSSTIRE